MIQWSYQAQVRTLDILIQLWRTVTKSSDQVIVVHAGANVQVLSDYYCLVLTAMP